WDVSVILHAYAAHTEEGMAEHLIGVAVAWGSNAQGTTIVMPNEDQWYVTYSHCSGFITRKPDPMVNLSRYRAMVTWRVPGIGVAPGALWLRHRPTTRQQPAPPSGSAVQGSNPPKPTRQRSSKR